MLDISHSDRRFQFTSTECRQFLKGHRIVGGVSEIGRCDDNAEAEVFFGQLKRKRGHRRRYLTLIEFRGDLFDASSGSKARLLRRFDAKTRP